MCAGSSSAPFPSRQLQGKQRIAVLRSLQMYINRLLALSNDPVDINENISDVFFAKMASLFCALGSGCSGVLANMYWYVRIDSQKIKSPSLEIKENIKSIKTHKKYFNFLRTEPYYTKFV
jgi:hypothetical protein